MRIIAIWPAEPVWQRDLALSVRFLRELGHDATLVVDEQYLIPGEKRQSIEFVKWSELSTNEWWNARKPDGVILGLFGATRHASIRAAALRNCNRVIERLDTDGTLAPAISLVRYFDAYWTHYADAGGGIMRAVAPILAAIRTIFLAAFPGLLFRRVALELASVPMITAPLPIAATRVEHFIARYAGTDRQVDFAPFAIDSSGFRFDPSVERRKRIVTIGRWTSRQKGALLMRDVLVRFLKEYPDWEATVIGTGATEFDYSSVSTRVSVAESLAPAQIARLLQQSRIYFLSSRQEGASLACSEALVSGCSIVGPASVACVEFDVSANSGTAATRRRPKELLDALRCEAELWNTGSRNPGEIAQHWRTIHDGDVATQRYVDLLTRLPR